MPMLRLDQNGNVILPVAQTCHANYEAQPLYIEETIFHNCIHHFGVPWKVSIHADIVGQLKVVIYLSRGCRYLQRKQLYVYILPAGATFLDMIN